MKNKINKLESERGFKKMKTNILAVMLIGVFLLSMVSITALDTRVNKEIKAEVSSLKIRNLNNVDEVSLKRIIPEEQIAIDAVNIAPRIRRFILWTNDGKNVMWGKYGNHHFYGEDNNGKKTWGIYYRGSFAGFYDGEFFYGRYSRDKWKARGLFGLNYSNGGFKTFPLPRLTATAKTLP